MLRGAVYELIAIFEDTKNLYSKNEYLKNAIAETCKSQEFIPDNASDDKSDIFNIASAEIDKTTKITVTKNRTMEAARKYVEQGKKTAVLNFASATTPGGGVTRGSSAQEECLCRVSTLYPCLTTKDMWEKFYAPHRSGSSNALYNDDIIYSKDIVVFKDDDYDFISKDNWFKVDVITCAAPNLREKPGNSFNAEASNEKISISDDELYKLHYSRAKAILSSAAKNNAEVLILGAFGCGAFRNNPKVVAKVYKDVLGEFQGVFEIIEFAVYCTYDDVNYRVFAEAFNV